MKLDFLIQSVIGWPTHCGVYQRRGVHDLVMGDTGYWRLKNNYATLVNLKLPSLFIN